MKKLFLLSLSILALTDHVFGSCNDDDTRGGKRARPDSARLSQDSSKRRLSATQQREQVDWEKHRSQISFALTPPKHGPLSLKDLVYQSVQRHLAGETLPNDRTTFFEQFVQLPSTMRASLIFQRGRYMQFPLGIDVPYVQHLDLKESTGNVSDFLWTQIIRFKSLRTLDVPGLGEAWAEHPSIIPLSHTTTLESLSLEGALLGYRKNPLTPLSNLRHLSYLNLGNCALGKQDVSHILEPLASLPHLEVLLLPHNALTDYGDFGKLAPLAHITSLTNLDLSFNEISFRQGSYSPLPAISPLTRLRSLNVSSNALGAQRDPAVSDLTQLQALSTLKLDNNALGIQRKSLSGLERLGALNVLTLEHNDLGHHHHDLAPLEHLACLDTLHLGGNRLNKYTDALAPISNLLYLRELRLNLNIKGHKDRILNLAPLANLPSLEVLDLSDNKLGTQPHSLEPLAGLTRLHTLKLSRNNLGPHAQSLGPLAGILSLQKLIMGENTFGRHPNEFNVLTNLYNLNTLDVGGFMNGDHTATSVIAITNVLGPHLQTLTIWPRNMPGGNELTRQIQVRFPHIEIN